MAVDLTKPPVVPVGHVPSRPDNDDHRRQSGSASVGARDARPTTGEVPSPAEARRLAEVHRYRILDTPADGTFDRITALAARVLDVPIAIVSVVDRDRIWFKSRHGLDLDQIPRHPGLCASAILGDDPFILADATADPVALANPLVAGEFGLRFYAAVPLTTFDGHNLGTLCVIDREPRTLTPAEVATLEDLGALVVRELELRLEARREAARQAAARDRASADKCHSDELARLLQVALLPPRLPRIAGVELAARYQPAAGFLVGGDFYDVFPLPRRAWGIAIGDVCGKDPRAAGVTAQARYALRAAAMEHDAPSEVLRLLNDALLLDADVDDPRFCTLVYARLRPHGDAFQLTVASAGHPLPRLLRHNGTVEPVGEYGTLAGCFPQAGFTDRTVRLTRGDTVVFYTDGLTEARAGDDEIGLDGVTELVRSCAGRDASYIAECLERAALDSGAQRDDVAILVLRASEHGR
ncbi:MAG: PP2C family protein-serine/threonine phosphatase [Acidimicrobiia bacterium]